MKLAGTSGIRRASAGGLLLLLGGCGMWREDAPRPLVDAGPRLGELVGQGGAVPPVEALATDVSAARVAALYAQALTDGTELNPAEQVAARRRMAVLQLTAAEDVLAAGGEPSFADALQAIDMARSAQGSAPELAYLQARALSLAGAEQRALQALDELLTMAPASEHAPEARFRQAEAAFSSGAWARAAAEFELVAQAPSSLQLHAHYMHGWARFKAGEPARALDAFVDVIGQVATSPDLGPSLAELRTDTLRVLVIVLSELDGVKSLAEVMATRERPAWQIDIYRALADVRLEQQRFVDTAHVLATFVQHNPLAAAAPAMFLRRLEVLRNHGLLATPADADRLRAEFVERYDISSTWYAAQRGAAVPEGRDAAADPQADPALQVVQTALASFLERLCQVAHAHAQQSGVAADWQQAAAWYARRALNFADDPAVPQWLVLQAEALEQADDLTGAIVVLEQMLAQHATFDGAADAGYALTDLHRRSGSAGLAAAQQRFITTFADDPRAPAVAISLAQDWYRGGQLQQAAELAEQTLAEHDLGTNDQTARELAAAAWFELECHDAALRAYRQLLVMYPDSGAEYRARLLASTFKQAQADLQAGAVASADQLLAQLVDIDADAELAVSGQFQRVTLALAANDLTGAATLLEQIRARWPDAARAQDVDLRLADLYERAGQPEQAAGAYLAIADAPQHAPERRRVAAYRAAEIALQLGDDETAAQRFERYLAQWPEPRDNYVEALAIRVQLAVAGSGDAGRWLEQQVQLAEGAGAPVSARARELAARAALQLAQGRAGQFAALQLGADLAATLPAKRDGLTAAFAAYERAGAFGVLEVTSRAGFAAAQLFEQFAEALLGSPRPALDAAALAEYELLLEEQAFVFEERAIELHAANVRLLPQAGLDAGTRASLAALARLYPARYQREEVQIAAVERIN